VVRQFALPELALHGLSARLPMPAKLADGDRVAIYWGSRNADWVFGELTRLGTTRPIVLIKGPPSTLEKAEFFAGEVGETIDLTQPSPPGAIT
jgi:hypothetical protein